ncbi:hypothetical protein ACIQWV_06000, partial [Streptomyces sp. NPDC098085]
MSLQFPPECAWLFAALTGEVPPDGDEDKMFALAEAHKGLHGKLNGDIQKQVADALGYTRKNFDGTAAEMYQEAMKAFLGGQEGLDYFNSVTEQAELIADFTRKSATQLQYTKYMIIAQLVELLVEAAVAMALSFFFGASIAAYLQKQAIVRLIIRTRLGRMLLTLLMHEIINVGMGVAMDALVQWTQLNQGTRDEWDGDLTKNAALSGAIQGLLAGPFHALGEKFSKLLSKMFGDDAGKQLGKKLDDVLPPPKNLGDGAGKNLGKHGGDLPPPKNKAGDDIVPPKNKAGDDIAPPPPSKNKGGDDLAPPPKNKAGDDVTPPPAKTPSGDTPKPNANKDLPPPPQSFGQDMTDIFRKHLPNTAGPNPEKAARNFVKDVGDAFERRFGGAEARDAGRQWASTLLMATGRKELPDALGEALEPIAKQLDDRVTKVLTEGTADAMGKSILQSIRGTTVTGLFEGAHAAVSEGTYNLIFSDEHTFSTSGLTFGSGIVEGRVGHVLETGGEKLGAGLRGSLGMDTPNLGHGAPSGLTDDMPDLGLDTFFAEPETGSLTDDMPDLALNEFFADADDDLQYLDVDEDPEYLAGEGGDSGAGKGDAQGPPTPIATSSTQPTGVTGGGQGATGGSTPVTTSNTANTASTANTANTSNTGNTANTSGNPANSSNSASSNASQQKAQDNQTATTSSGNGGDNSTPNQPTGLTTESHGTPVEDPSRANENTDAENRRTGEENADHQRPPTASGTNSWESDGQGGDDNSTAETKTSDQTNSSTSDENSGSPVATTSTSTSTSASTSTYENAQTQGKLADDPESLNWGTSQAPHPANPVQQNTGGDQQKISQDQRNTSEEQRKTTEEQQQTTEEQQDSSEGQRSTSEEQQNASEEQRSTSEEQQNASEEQHNTPEEQGNPLAAAPVTPPTPGAPVSPIALVSQDQPTTPTETDLTETDSTDPVPPGQTPPPPPPPVPHAQPVSTPATPRQTPAPLSAAVQNLGTDSRGLPGGVQFSPLAPELVNTLHEQVRNSLEIPEEHRAEVDGQLATLLSAQALHDNRVMLLSPDGHRIHLVHGGATHPVDVRLRLSDPAPSLMYGQGRRIPPRNNEERYSAGYDSNSQVSTTAVRTLTAPSWVGTFANNAKTSIPLLSTLWNRITGFPVSVSPTGTLGRNTMSTTVSQSVVLTSLLRSNEPATPYDYKASWSVSTPTVSVSSPTGPTVSTGGNLTSASLPNPEHQGERPDDLPLQTFSEDNAHTAITIPGDENARTTEEAENQQDSGDEQNSTDHLVTAWFPEHLTKPPAADDTDPAPLYGHSADDFRKHLDKLPLWALDSMSDPGVLLRDVRQRFGSELDRLSPESLAAVERFFSAQQLLGALPLQLPQLGQNAEDASGTLSPLLLDADGKALGMFKVVAEVDTRQGDGLHDIKVDKRFNFERSLDRQIKVDALSKASLTLGGEISAGANWNALDPDSDSGLRDFNVGLNSAVKGGGSWQKDRGFGAGSTHNALYNLRANNGHVLTPARVAYRVAFIAADGSVRPDPTAQGDRTTVSAPATDVWIRALSPQTVNGTVPENKPRPPAEVAALESLGLSSTPLALDGAGVHQVLKGAGDWLRDNGYLPKADESAIPTDERLIKARLENLRKLTLLTSPTGLQAGVDEMIDGGYVIHFNKPTIGGGNDRVALQLDLSPEPPSTNGAGSQGVSHQRTINGVVIPNISGLSVPGTSQSAQTTSTWIGGNTELGGSVDGPVRGAVTGEIKRTKTSAETLTVGSGLAYSQLIATSNQATEVFRVPTVLSVKIQAGENSLYSDNSSRFTPADTSTENARGPRAYLDVALPASRTLAAAVQEQAPAQAQEQTQEQTQEQRQKEAQDPGGLLPDGSLVDILRGSKELNTLLHDMLGEVPPAPTPSETPASETPTSEEQGHVVGGPMPGALPPEQPPHTQTQTQTQTQAQAQAQTTVSNQTQSPAPAPGTNTGTASSLWTSAVHSAKSLAGHILNAATTVRQTLVGDTLTSEEISLSEALHAQLTPAALSARAHQLVKGVYVIDDLFVPAALAGTDLVVEIRAKLSNLRSLGEVTQYGEIDLGLVDSASRQTSSTSSLEGGGGFSLKSTALRADAEAAAAKAADPLSAPDEEAKGKGKGKGKAVSGGGGAKGVYGRGDTRAVTAAASTSTTRVPSESGKHVRISADITYEVTLRRGTRGGPVSRSGAVTEPRTVTIEGGIQFLATPEQLRRDNGRLVDLLGLQDLGEGTPANAPLPYRFVQRGTLGLAAVLDVTPLSSPLPLPVTANGTPGATEPNPAPQNTNPDVDGQTETPDVQEQPQQEQNEQEQSEREQIAPEQEETTPEQEQITPEQDQATPEQEQTAPEQEQTAPEQETTDPTPPAEPRIERDLYHRRLTALVEAQAPGALTPGSSHYVPGLRQRLADFTSPAAMAALTGRGRDQPLSFTFPYPDGVTTKDVTVHLAGRPSWSSEQLLQVKGRESAKGAGLETFTQHAPNNITQTRSRTTKWGGAASGSLSIPTIDDSKHKLGLAPSATHTTTRTDTVTNTSTAEDRLWMRTEGGAEFRLAWTFTASMEIDGTTYAIDQVDAAVTVRFAKDEDPLVTGEAPAEPNRLPKGVRETDPRNTANGLLTAVPVRPTGTETVYEISHHQELLQAVHEVAPELAKGATLSSGASDEAAAARLTELLHGGEITVDSLRQAAGFGGSAPRADGTSSVKMTTQLLRPKIIGSSRGVTIDHVRQTGSGTTATSSVSRSSAFSLGANHTVDSKGEHTLGVSTTPFQFQSVPQGQGGGVSAGGRRWTKIGTAGLPTATKGLQTHEVEVDTVTTVTRPGGPVRYVTGTAILRVSETDLRGLGILPPGNGVWDLPPLPTTPTTTTPTTGTANATDTAAPTDTANGGRPDADLIQAITTYLTEEVGEQPDGQQDENRPMPQLWLALGPQDGAAQLAAAETRAVAIATAIGSPVELAVHDNNGIHYLVVTGENNEATVSAGNTGNARPLGGPGGPRGESVSSQPLNRPSMLPRPPVAAVSQNTAAGNTNQVNRDESANTLAPNEQPPTATSTTPTTPISPPTPTTSEHLPSLDDNEDTAQDPTPVNESETASPTPNTTTQHLPSPNNNEDTAQDPTPVNESETASPTPNTTTQHLPSPP